MSARYPLVRNVSAFSTRVGVLSSPSRPGSSPSSASRFRISSRICLLYICGFTQLVAVQSADGLYRDRANLESARKAAETWRTELSQNPSAFEPAWKLARAD